MKLTRQTETAQKLYNKLINDCKTREIDREELKDLTRLDRNKREEFLINAIELINSGTPRVRETITYNLRHILSDNIKKIIWDGDRVKIEQAICDIVSQANNIPEVALVAQESGYSVPYVEEHLGKNKANVSFPKKEGIIAMMQERMVAKMYQVAMIKADPKAARLFLEATGALGNRGNTTVYNTQNNFIQVNGLTLSQEQIMLLPPEQQQRVADLLLTMQPYLNQPRVHSIGTNEKESAHNGGKL